MCKSTVQQLERTPWVTECWFAYALHHMVDGNTPYLLPAIYADPHFCMLVLACLQVTEHLTSQFSQETTTNKVVLQHM